MADFDSSYDFGEEVTGGSDFETVDISDSEDKVDVESEAEIWIDASEETDVEVPISSEDEMMIDDRCFRRNGYGFYRVHRRF